MNTNLNNSSKKQNHDLGKKFTRLEIVLGLILIALAVYILYSEIAAQNEVVEVNECADLACYESIIEIQSFIDPSVDRCEDFHQFACGGFLENAFKMKNLIIQEQNELTNELEAMIVEPISSKDSEAVKTQKMFFQECLNVDKSSTDQDKIVLDLIDQIGGWPMQKGQAWNEKEFQWMDVMIKCKKLGLPFQWFLEFGLHVEEINYLKISYPTFADQLGSIGRKGYNVKNVINNLFEKNISSEEILSFERQLKNVTSKQNSLLLLKTIEELKTAHPLYNWVDFLNNITEGGYEISEETQVASNIEQYMVKLHQLLEKTPKRTQANYIIWKIIEHFAPYRSNIVTKEAQIEDRRDFCKEETRISFPYVSELEYTRKYSTPEVTQSVRELTNLIRDEFLNRLKDATWWNSTVGQNYLETFNDTEIDIGLNLGDRDANTVEDFLNLNYYHLGNFSSDFKNSNIIDVVKDRSWCYYNSIFSNINETGIDPEEKQLALQTNENNIFFHEGLNKIVVPPSMLHGFLYNHNRPKYLNFGGLGTSMAKELIKSLQNYTGNIKNVTNVAFETSNRCFEDDYLSLTSEAENDLNSFDLVQKIVPDIVARDIAYAAYQNWVATNEDEIGLPLLSFNPNQLFWIKSSLINCYKKLPDGENGIEVVSSKYTNIFSARHSRYFGDDFGCSEDKRMDPTKKC